MRLQLKALLAASLVAAALPPAGAASAQDRGSAVRTRAALYHDDDATTVVTAAVEAEAVIADRFAVRVGYLADVITTASVDVIAAATTRWDERRDELRTGAEVILDDGTLSASYTRSLENDYGSHSVGLGGTVDLAKGSTTLGLGVGFIHSDVGRFEDPTFDAVQRTYTAEAGLTQLLDTRTLVGVGYGLIHVAGYQASPYRFVQATPTTFVAERHPDSRFRHALTGRLRRALGDTIALRIDERLYVDDWGVFGTTTHAVLAVELAEAVDFELRDRFHFQTAASFYHERYDEQRRFMTADRELSTFLDNYVGPALVFNLDEAGPFEQLRFDVRADFFYYRFFDFAFLRNRVGTLVSLGGEATF